MKTLQTKHADTYQDERGHRFPLPSEAQPDTARHSPLPWYAVKREIRKDYGDVAYVLAETKPSDEGEADAMFIVASVNHAGKLAEALRHALRREEALDIAAHPVVINHYRSVLEAYEADQ